MRQLFGNTILEKNQVNYQLEDKTYTIKTINSDKIKKAIGFIEELYKNRKRDQGTSFINHPLEVVKIIQNEFNIILSDDYLVIALIHDALWVDFENTKKKIIEQFGEDIYSKVEKLTKPHIIEKRQKRSKDEKQFFENISKLNDELLYIKFADRLNNLREVKFASKEKQKKFIKATYELYMNILKEHIDNNVFKNIYDIFMDENK